MAYPPPPPSGAPTGKPRLRGRTPLRLAIIFLILGIAGIVTGAVLLVNGAFDKVDGFQRIKVPAAVGTENTGTVTFTGTGGYLAYYESDSVDVRRVPIVAIRLTSQAGTQITPDTLYGGVVVDSSSVGKVQKLKSLTYDYDGHHGAAVWQFTIAQKGTYRVEVAGSSLAAADAQMAFGRSIAKSTVGGALIVVAGVLLFIAGVVLLIVGLVKRSRSKKEIAAQAAYPGGYPQQYGSYPQQGFPQQGPQQGFPQQGFQPGYSPPGPQSGYPPPGYQPPGAQPPAYPQQSSPPPAYPQQSSPPPSGPSLEKNPWRPRDED